MKIHHFLPLAAAVCLTFMGADSKAQQIVSATNTNISLPLDPFFDDEEFEKDYPHVVCLKFHLKEDKLPELLTEVALKNIICPFKGCSVSLIDIIEATRISRFSTEVLAEALATINIPQNDQFNMLLLYNLNPSSIEKFLQKFGLTFSDIYNNFVKSLTNPSQMIPNILNILNVSVVDFMNAQVYGNDTLKLTVLSNGNYSEENLEAVLNITNKTGLDMLKLLPLNTIAGQLKKQDEAQFTNFIKNVGVTSEKLAPFYQYLNITPINFLSYPPFIQIITGFYDILNPEEVLGTFVSQNKVVTINRAKVLLGYQDPTTVTLRSFANFHVELVENPLVQYVVKNLTLTAPGYQSQDIAVVEIKIPVVITIAEIFNLYNNSALLTCSYVSKLPFGELQSQNVSVQVQPDNHVVTIAKTNTTVYNLGSPLFCQDKLFGMAAEEGTQHIKFVTFMKKRYVTGGTPPTSGEKPGVGQTGGFPSTSKPGSGALGLSCAIFNIMVALAASKLAMNFF